MYTKKLLAGTITGTLIFFFMNIIVNAFFLTDFLSTHQGLSTASIRSEELLPFSIASKFLLSFLLTYLFLFAKVNTVIGGMILSAIIAFFIKSSIYFHLYATTTLLSKSGLMAEVICFTFISSLVGGSIIMIADFTENAQVLIESDSKEIRLN